VSLPPPRDRSIRRADTLAALTRRPVDAWVASADLSADGTPRPYLVPLSLAWFEERIVLALEAGSRTARGIQRHGTARVGVGPTRDVVLIDAVLEKVVSTSDADDALGDGYAARSDWDPRTAGAGYVYLILAPRRIQAWREANELAGRLLMRDGMWIED
jgi:hypothetical protein